MHSEKDLNNVGSENCDLMPSFFLKNIQAEFTLIKPADDQKPHLDTLEFNFWIVWIMS